METMDEYTKRTQFMKDYRIKEGMFSTNPDLADKVSADGQFVTFVGDTVVFDLDPMMKKKLDIYRSVIYEYCPKMLAERIKEKTFHITLHDLCSGQPSEALWMKSENHRIQAKEILQQIRYDIDCTEEWSEVTSKTEDFVRAKRILIKPVAFFNMVGTSIVLGFEPLDQESCERLMKLYERFHVLVPLDRKLTLHATLAYFKPGCYSQEQIDKLNKVLDYLNKLKLEEIALDINKLQYQRFDDMNTYYCPEN